MEFALDKYTTKQELKKHMKKISYRCGSRLNDLKYLTIFWSSTIERVNLIKAYYSELIKLCGIKKKKT